MTKGLIADQWAQFSDRCLPVNVSDVQRREMKRSFYAGAQGLMNVIKSILVEPGDDVTDDEVSGMARVANELKEFAKAVLEGRE